MSLDWIYWAISWILLTWHGAWDAIGVSAGEVLGTNWSWILAIIFLVVTVRVILFPIFVKQIKSQRAMQALQPQVKALQEKHKGDREALQREMMELYRKEKANPLMGCLPMFLQVPVFLGLFHVLRRLDPAQTKNTTLYGWTQEKWDSAAIAELFNVPISAKFGSTAQELELTNTSATSVKIIAGVLVLIMILTTYLTSRQMILKTGWAEDPQQRMIQKLMLYGIPASLLISGAIFPIGVVIYWVVNNLFSLGQQQWVLRKYPPLKIASVAKSAGKDEPVRKGPPPKGPAARAAAAGRGGAPKGTSARGRFAKGASGANGKPGDTPVIDGRALAPKPGAKPVKPKKGGPAKRQAG